MKKSGRPTPLTLPFITGELSFFPIFGNFHQPRIIRRKRAQGGEEPKDDTSNRGGLSNSVYCARVRCRRCAGRHTQSDSRPRPRAAHSLTGTDRRTTEVHVRRGIVSYDTHGKQVSLSLTRKNRKCVRKKLNTNNSSEFAF